MYKTFSLQDMLDTQPCDILKDVLLTQFNSTSSITLKEIFFNLPMSLGNRAWLILSLSKDPQIIYNHLSQYFDQNQQPIIPGSLNRFITYIDSALTKCRPTLDRHYLTDALMFLKMFDQKEFDKVIDLIFFLSAEE